VPFHQKSIEETLEELKSSRSGLDGDEARERLETYGPNELKEKRGKTPLMMFLGQFTDFMILVLIAAAVISGVVGEPSDAIAIIVIVVLNAALGFTQEYRAERAIAALKKMATTGATVIRGGAPETVPVSQIVPGDVVALEAGMIVPADMRLIEAARLNVEEAALTGESLAIEKQTNAIHDTAAPLGDRRNMLYKGTFITHGRGIGVVTTTGMETELGRIAAMIQGEEEGKTPLQKRLASFGRRLAFAILAICAIIFVGGLLRGEAPVRIFLVAVSLAVAAIPEALPAVVTISLALGARKMVQQHALVRKLPAVETLGSVTYICTDKTGTLTLNRMTVEEVWVDGKTVRSSEFKVRSKNNKKDGLFITQSAPPALAATLVSAGGMIGNPKSLLLTALALSNDAQRDPSGTVLGDPTEAALFAVAAEHGFEKKELEQVHPRAAELPFDSERKLMTTFHEWNDAMGKAEGVKGKYVSFTKGAIEVLLERSTRVLTSEGAKPLNKEELLRQGDRLAADGLRVMAVGMRAWDEVPAAAEQDKAEEEIILLGLVGMMDPPREEAKESVALCRRAGITPVMITGDHPLTAKAIAKRVGLLEEDDRAGIITGRELDALSLDEFEKRVERIRVYARVAPEQKLKIVRALQDRGHFVAMTGDGVNDAPALKRADIGVAMGVTGTDVAKEASSMILLDDNFATIVKAVKEGRRIYDNIRKFIKYLLSTNSGELWTLFLAPFFGLPIPLLPIHILWINLLTDGLPALALSLEPAEGDVMNRPPRSPKESIFSHGLGIHAIWVGLLMAAIVLSLQAWTIHIGDGHWQTMVFSVLCFLQLGHVMAIRSERLSLFTQGIFTNKPLLLTVAGMLALQLMTIYVPSLNQVFKTQPLSGAELAAVFVLSTAVFLSVELEKLIKRRGKPA
jgi:Ca2+-transporting ATPase